MILGISDFIQSFIVTEERINCNINKSTKNQLKIPGRALELVMNEAKNLFSQKFFRVANMGSRFQI